MSDGASGEVRVRAPATVANVGPGYDCFGFALEGLGDMVTARRVEGEGVRIVEIRGDGGQLPREASKNTAGRAAQSVWSDPRLGGLGLELTIEKGLPLFSGLGSSASSAVAGALAAMTLRCEVTGESCERDLVLAAALDGEELASGCRHADNVAPALLGGFTVVQSSAPVRVGRFVPALPLAVSVVMPELRISTREAREVLPREVALGDAVANWSNAAALVVALLQGEVALLRAALSDRIVEPCRARLIPGFDTARKAALEAGALGFSISGSGPALFALALDEAVAGAIGAAVVEALGRHGVAARAVTSHISPQGAHPI